MVDVRTEITITKELEQVAEYAMNPDSAPEWYDNIQSAVWQTTPPLQKGSQIAFKAQFMKKELFYTYEVLEYDPPHKMVMKTVDGPFPMETTYEFIKKENEGTLMKLRNRGKPSGFSILFTPLMKMMMRKANKKDLRKIKLILEARQTKTT
ncbi:MAG: SRPBCC family protein [Flavobacteriales bacterium]|nr:SRPBCC family protein [Flavobacteriales bacterium]